MGSGIKGGDAIIYVGGYAYPSDGVSGDDVRMRGSSQPLGLPGWNEESEVGASELLGLVAGSRPSYSPALVLRFGLPQVPRSLSLNRMGPLALRQQQLDLRQFPPCFARS